MFSFSAIRALAPAVLLLASLSGYGATGIVLAHVTTDHAVAAGHADHNAAHHAPETEDERRDADHSPGHTHEFTLATVAVPARIACRSIEVQPLFAVVADGHFDRPDPQVLTLLARPVPRVAPLEPQRRSILLL